MFPTSLPPSSAVWFIHMCFFSVSLFVMTRNSRPSCLLSAPIGLFFLCFSVKFSFWSLFIFDSLTHAYAHTMEHTHTHTHSSRQRVLESEEVTVVFSGQLGLISSTFCFRTLTDSLKAETGGERKRETQRRRTLNTAFMDFI